MDPQMSRKSMSVSYLKRNCEGSGIRIFLAVGLFLFCSFAISLALGARAGAAECNHSCNQVYRFCEMGCNLESEECLDRCPPGIDRRECRKACKAVEKACHSGCVGGKKQCKSACPKGPESPSVPLARLIHEPPTATADLAVPPGVLGPRTLRRTV